MIYCNVLIRTSFLILGFFSLVAARTSNASAKRSLHCDRALSEFSQNFQSPSIQSKLPTLRGGSKPSSPLSIESRNELKGLTLSRGLESVRASKRRWKQKELVALLLLRVGFFIILPFSILFLTISIMFWLITVIIRITSLNFAGKELSEIAYVVCKAFIASTFASLTGIFLPIFAMFGLIASLTAAGIEIAEPMLRIKYRRILRKLRHLQKILNDPVLLETIDIMSRNAQAITVTTSRQMQSVSLRTKKLGKATHDSVQDTSAQLIESLIQSPSVIAWQERVKKRLPDPVIVWTKDQVDLLRKSGVLEEAAAHALNALSKSKEFSVAAKLLPYVEAINKVNQNMQKKKK